ncbi:MAG: hypothetical protein KatS3mg076_2063 [Candidatus Binatia bacterium]|nr:MAG: hypothetical protein KatS3mg076_2063 [Candidatus Binatia bacterium]
MSTVRRSDTAPEVALQRALRRLKLRFVTQNRHLPGTPDIVFKKSRLVVFVHGCFWHRHPDCRLATVPRTNRAFWLEKFKSNVRRDRRKVRLLRQAGWRVAVAWQCRIEDDVEKIARRLARMAAKRRVVPGANWQGVEAAGIKRDGRRYRTSAEKT